MTDRRVARTHRSLRTALVSLVLERGWDAVSVKDVCEAADVGRSTFYAHFADKESLLTSGFDGLAAELRAAPAAAGPLRFSRPLVEHALDHRPLFRVLVGNRCGEVVQRRFRRLVLDLVCEELGWAPEAAEARFVAAGLVDVLLAGVESPRADAAQIDADIQRLVRRMCG